MLLKMPAPAAPIEPEFLPPSTAIVAAEARP
jgi:hypothetical protein